MMMTRRSTPRPSSARRSRSRSARVAERPRRRPATRRSPTPRSRSKAPRARASRRPTTAKPASDLRLRLVLVTLLALELVALCVRLADGSELSMYAFKKLLVVLALLGLHAGASRRPLLTLGLSAAAVVLLPLFGLPLGPPRPLASGVIAAAALAAFAYLSHAMGGVVLLKRKLREIGSEDADRERG